MSAGCGGWGVAVTLMTSPGVPRQAIAWRGHREMALVLDGRSAPALRHRVSPPWNLAAPDRLKPRSRSRSRSHSRAESGQTLMKQHDQRNMINITRRAHGTATSYSLILRRSHLHRRSCRRRSGPHGRAAPPCRPSARLRPAAPEFSGGRTHALTPMEPFHRWSARRVESFHRWSARR